MDGCLGKYAQVGTLFRPSLMSLTHSFNPNFSLGDLKYKRFGVTPEPEVRTKLLHGR